jgi:hypothetical protein
VWGVGPIPAKPRLWHVAALIAYLALILGILRALGLDATSSISGWLFPAMALGLTAPNLVGPIRAIGQFSRRGELFAGEILWAWVGLVWMTLDPNNLSRVVGIAILTMLLAIGVGVFGLRPEKRDGAWAHHAGWALLAANAVFYGIYVRYFRRS